MLALRGAIALVIFNEEGVILEKLSLVIKHI
jgi:hypothetical protein